MAFFRGVYYTNIKVIRMKKKKNKKVLLIYIIIAAIIIMFISQKKGESADIIIALVATGALAIGVIITAATRGLFRSIPRNM